MLALKAIRCDLQAELAVAPVALEPPPSTPASLMLRTSCDRGIARFEAAARARLWGSPPRARNDRAVLVEIQAAGEGAPLAWSGERCG